MIVVRKTLEEFSDLVRKRILGPDVRSPAFGLSSGHKLCDLKPMYGVLFADELRDYDYWAFGDCDLLYGRRFDDWLGKAVAGGYEVATVQRDFTAGPFTLVKNCDKCNRLFEKAADWREILFRPETMAFDELGEKWFRKWCFGHRPHARLREEQSSFSAICWREREAGRLRLLSEPVICEDGLKRGERVGCRPDGALMVGGREVAMYHFITVKTCFGFAGDDRSVWLSRGWPFWRDLLRFAAKWLSGDRPARRRVAEWWQRRRGNPDWWKGAGWNNLPPEGGGVV